MKNKLTSSEYIHAHPFSGDYSTLAKAIEPNITSGQAKKAVENLESLGLIKMSNDGIYRISDAILTTGQSVNSLAARDLHKSMLEIAANAMDITPASHQYFRTIIGSFSDEALGQIKLELDGMRKRILEIIASDTSGPRRYQRHTRSGSGKIRHSPNPLERQFTQS